MKSTAIITVLAAENPKRSTAALRFNLYKKCRTVADYIRACKRRRIRIAKAMADIRWDQNHGYIAVK